MKLRLLFGLAIMCGTMTSAVLLLIANQTPPMQLSFETADGGVPATSAASDLPPATPITSSIRLLGAPRQSSSLFASDLPLPTPAPAVATTGPAYLFDLNTDHEFYGQLGLSLAQAQAVFSLRCTPVEPPFKPSPVPLEGCGPEATGIVVLDQIVEAGVLSEAEVIDLLAGKVRQTWR